MRRMLRDALASGASRVTSSASSAYHGTINVGLAGYNMVKPAGSAVINTTLATLLHLRSFAQETMTGVVFVYGQKVSGDDDSLLKLSKQRIPAAVNELFAPDERSLLTKGSDFMKTAGTYAGGVAASF